MCGCNNGIIPIFPIVKYASGPLAKLCQSQKITFLDQLHFSKKILFIEISQISGELYSIMYIIRAKSGLRSRRGCAAVMENI